MEIKTGLWKKTSKDGATTYYFGQRDGVKVTLFKNTRKKNDNDPDLNVIVDIEDGAGQEYGAPPREDDDSGIPF